MKEGVTLQTGDPIIKNVLLTLSEALESRASVEFSDVVAAKRCKKYTVREIGQALEFLRRNGYVRAASRFGCSELLSFSASGITDKGKDLLKII